MSEKFLLINSFEEEYADREELINVYKRIHRLDEKSKEVVYLRIKCEFNFKEIIVFIFLDLISSFNLSNSGL